MRYKLLLCCVSTILLYEFSYVPVCKLQECAVQIIQYLSCTSMILLDLITFMRVCKFVHLVGFGFSRF
jgi:hypothetical protein